MNYELRARYTAVRGRKERGRRSIYRLLSTTAALSQVSLFVLAVPALYIHASTMTFARLFPFALKNKQSNNKSNIKLLRVSRVYCAMQLYIIDDGNDVMCRRSMAPLGVEYVELKLI